MTFFKLYSILLSLMSANACRSRCQARGAFLPVWMGSTRWIISPLTPRLSGVYSYSDATIFSGCLARSHVLDTKRENPISAVTFCLCSGNIQGPYIKGKRGARQRGGSFNDGGKIMPCLLERLFQGIIPGLNPATRPSHKHWNIEAAGVTHAPPPARDCTGTVLWF